MLGGDGFARRGKIRGRFADLVGEGSFFVAGLLTPRWFRSRRGRLCFRSWPSPSSSGVVWCAGTLSSMWQSATQGHLGGVPVKGVGGAIRGSAGLAHGRTQPQQCGERLRGPMMSALLQGGLETRGEKEEVWNFGSKRAGTAWMEL